MFTYILRETERIQNSIQIPSVLPRQISQKQREKNLLKWPSLKFNDNKNIKMETWREQNNDPKSHMYTQLEAGEKIRTLIYPFSMRNLATPRWYGNTKPAAEKLNPGLVTSRRSRSAWTSLTRCSHTTRDWISSSTTAPILSSYALLFALGSSNMATLLEPSPDLLISLPASPRKSSPVAAASDFLSGGGASGMGSGGGGEGDGEDDELVMKRRVGARRGRTYL